MRKLTFITLVALMSAMYFVACAKKQNSNDMKQNESKAGKVLVTFFSRTGENYAVGNITKGNTHIVAEMVAKQTGGDLFEIQPVKPYPTGYEKCTEVAQEEKSSNARPAIKEDKDIAGYDTIYIGYPIWWGDAPMPVYTWIEKHDWQGKTVIPFCTHEGSGLGSSPDNIATACKGAILGEGLEIQGSTAQRQQDKTRQIVERWLGNTK